MVLINVQVLPIYGQDFSGISEQSRSELVIDSLEKELMSGKRSESVLNRSSENIPRRPIAQTAVGIGLTSSGAALLIISGIYFALGSGVSSNDDVVAISMYAYSILYGLIGVGEIIPGIIMISVATSKWSRFNEWHKKQRSGKNGWGVKLEYVFHLGEGGNCL
jgi:hypothetical protein